MKKYKQPLIIASVVLAILCVTFMMGGSAPSSGENDKSTDLTTPVADPVSGTDQVTDVEPVVPVDTPLTPVTEPKKDVPPAPPQEKLPNTETPKETDKYKTEPVPEGKPEPAEPQDTNVDKKTELTCTISVHCDTILNNKDNLDPEKSELVPEDGVIFAEQSVVFYEGESVFNVLQREMKKNKVHMEFTNTPIYNSAYIEGIGNLYEFDCGELSGWMYRVNDWFPNYGCSRYELKDGDKIEWIFTCDLGADIGGDYSAQTGNA